jgi:hypothetical protein
VRYNDDKLKVDYSYDALGRRLHKHSVAHFWDRPRPAPAGTSCNGPSASVNRCGFTLFGWDGDTLAWESSPPLDEGDTGRTVHYLYEPGSFVPVAQALRNGPIRLHKQPDWSQREYDFDQDPLWHTEVKPQAFDAMAWYHCHLGTPQELTDEQGNVLGAVHGVGRSARGAHGASQIAGGEQPDSLPGAVPGPGNGAALQPLSVLRAENGAVCVQGPDWDAGWDERLQLCE